MDNKKKVIPDSLNTLNTIKQENNELHKESDKKELVENAYKCFLCNSKIKKNSFCDLCQYKKMIFQLC